MNTRDQALDGLRGIAILLVLVGHLIEIQPTSALTGWLNQAIKSLWIGVDLFFVLSGYLITDILVRTRQDARRVRNFYMRRALRIFPAYYLIVIGTVLVVTAFHGDARIVADTISITRDICGRWRSRSSSTCCGPGWSGAAVPSSCRGSASRCSAPPCC